ncbi:hypothetical protein HanHA300_Chr09g0334681 [Helianthus annuus]|nr:hypothetical protein HanHA300_Chr09g0334681 [Helianthus annuus]KAJ0543912.1 hypothetical protein HanHA89_Chr09g0355751 [Helianthus annuus]KAJ0708966.1 hypothetical protein HanLR1_Chr09g0335061 [Helianthus annuus]
MILQWSVNDPNLPLKKKTLYVVTCNEQQNFQYLGAYSRKKWTRFMLKGSASVFISC